MLSHFIYDVAHVLAVPKPSRPVSIAKVKGTAKTLPSYTRKPGHAPPGRAYKVKARRGRNMTLNNSTRPYSYVMSSFPCHAGMICSSRSTRRSATKRVNKYVDKPCPRFTTTGALCFSCSCSSRLGRRNGMLALRGRACGLSSIQYSHYTLCFFSHVLFLWTTTLFRYLRPRTDMHVST